MRTLLIDGDMVAWNVAYNPNNIPARAVGWLHAIKRDLAADRAIVCFSDPSRGYWRRKFWPDYKSKRSEPPAGLAEAKMAMADAFIHRTLDGMEADDVMGILSTSAMEGQKIIVANDKDMLTIPGQLYRPKDKSMLTSDESQADHAHMMQTLTGDSGDGYPGCPGIGPEKAAKILASAQTPREKWIRVVLAFKSKGLTYADALVQARVARICRSCDFDIASRTVVPWEPPKE